MEDTTVYLFEKFMEVEDKYDLFSIVLNHTKIWQYIRFSFCALLIETLTGIKTTNRDNNLILKKTKEMYFKDWFKKQQFLLRNKDVLVVNHPRRVKDGDIYKCFVTDAFLKQLRVSYYVFEDSYQGEHFKPVETKGLKYRNVDRLKSLCSYREPNSAETKKIADRIIKIFEKEYCVNFNSEFKRVFLNSIKVTMQSIFYGKLYAKIILKLIKPKVVILAVHYRVFNQTLIETAKELNIPTIEFQHGRIGDSHAAYNFKRCRNLETFPDYIFVYGRYEKEIPRYPISKDHIYMTGYPELEKKAEFYRSIGRKRSYKVVTFISSPVEGKVVSKFAIDLASKMRGKKVRIVYKLHPSEYCDWKSHYDYNAFNALGIYVVGKNQHDIYHYLGHSDYVVGISSTVLFEAMQFDIEIVIIKKQDFIKCEAIYNHGYASLVSDIDELLDIIDNGKKSNAKITDNFYFEDNSILKMNKAFHECIRKSK